MTDAFKRLGHDVRHIGRPMGRAIWGLELPERYEWTPDIGFVITGHVDDDKRRLEQNDVAYFEPDLIIIMDSDAQILNEQIRAPHTVPMIVFGVDNHVREYRRPWFDHYFLAHYDGHVQPVRRFDESWLPCAYDPVAFTPSEIPYAEREYDVCMLGVMYNHRRALVNALTAAGIKVFWGTGLVYEEYAAAYHNSRISLCASFNGDVAQRVFETAALGCMVVSDDCDDYQRLKPRGLHITESRFLVDRVRMLLNDPAHAQACIQESLEWVAGHTWDNRARRIVEWMEAQKAGEIINVRES